MKILKLEIQNYRRISALELNLDGKNFAVAGGTGQGKTTVISSLWEALKKVGDPVKHGEDKGKIRITLGDGETEVFVTRGFKGASAPLTVLTSKGETVSAAEFAEWFCELGSNPHKIMDMKPTEQAAALLSAVVLPEGVDLDALDAGRLFQTERRLTLHRLGHEAAGRVGEEPEKVDPVDIVPLIAEERAGQEVNDQRAEADRLATHAEETAESWVGDVDRKRAALEVAKRELAESEKSLGSARKESGDLVEKYNKLPDEVDLAEVRARLTEAHNLNAGAVDWDNWSSRELACQEIRRDWKKADDEVKRLDREKAEALNSAEWPLDELDIVDGVVTFRETPLDQCGHSEIMLVCGALAAASISRHKLRVVRMDGVESMSRPDFEQLSNIFDHAGIQVLSSRVSRGDVEDGEIEIVDGAAPGVPGSVLKPKAPKVKKAATKSKAETGVPDKPTTTPAPPPKKRATRRPKP